MARAEHRRERGSEREIDRTWTPIAGRSKPMAALAAASFSLKSAFSCVCVCVCACVCERESVCVRARACVSIPLGAESNGATEQRSNGSQ